MDVAEHGDTRTETGDTTISGTSRWRRPIAKRARRRQTFQPLGGRLERGRLRMSGSAVVRAFGLAGVQDHSLINPGESERSRP